mmetsp:Transcript_52836/g.150640  ORF Transcript_52836/g.150640 Transcript_52836/m.150640 type:complete len:202 (-) Transcript_52836:1690-2295(-)
MQSQREERHPGVRHLRHRLAFPDVRLDEAPAGHKVCEVQVSIVRLVALLPVRHVHQRARAVAHGRKNPQLADPAALVRSVLLRGPEPNGALVMDPGAEEGEAVALRLGNLFHPVEDASRGHAPQPVEALLRQRQAHALRVSGAGLRDADGHHARRERHRDVCAAPAGDLDREPEVAVLEVGRKPAKHFLAPARREILVCRP